MVIVKLPFRRDRFAELTDSQWEAINDFVDNGRKRKNCLRTILNAIFKWEVEISQKPESE
ncbi:MAG TPA: hypothetical protein ENJ20_07980 [Bacteroidetes bacterium]|nr:hypothetical protein [Bacteroidota bacterium]